MAAAALCAALCACSKPQDVLPDHIATPEASATVAPTAAVVQATATPTPTDTTVPTILPQTADAGRSYVDDTLFIGDSNTVRYTMYADDTGTETIYQWVNTTDTDSLMFDYSKPELLSRYGNCYTAAAMSCYNQLHSKSSDFVP